MRMQKRLLTWMTACFLMICAGPSFAAPEDAPSAGAMAADLIVARPLGMLATVFGTAVFVVSLPLSALGGNVEEAAETLVLGPGRAAFVRCLGCRTSGRYQSSYD